jgi:hypothetical protein
MRGCTVIEAAEIRTLPDDDGPIPRQVKAFPAGWMGVLPSHQHERAKRKGVLAPDAADDSGQEKTANGDEEPGR